MREICQDKLMHYRNYLASIDELNTLIGSEAPNGTLFGENKDFLAETMPKVKNWQRMSIIPHVRNHIVHRW